MKQLTKQQAIQIGESKVWQTWTPQQIAKFQYLQEKLCVPFSLFHKSVETVLGGAILDISLTRECVKQSVLDKCKEVDVSNLWNTQLK